MDYAGKRIKTHIPDFDTDENGKPRDIPIGTIGTVHPLYPGESEHHVKWDNGAYTIWSPEEIERDAEIVS